MTTLESTHQLAQRARNSSGAILAALGTIVAVAVAVLVLSLTGASTSKSVAHGNPPPYYPLIHYHGTGAPPAKSAAPTAHTSHATSTLLRAEHSYGATP